MTDSNDRNRVVSTKFQVTMLDWKQMQILDKGTIFYSYADSIKSEGVVANNDEKSVKG